MEKKVLDGYQFNDELIEFDNCIFNKSDFSNFDFSAFEFTECTFNSCDFSMACLTNTVLSGVNFINCKLLGVDFSRCSKFAYSVKFENCILDYCSFIRNNLGKVILKNSSIREATFSETNLSSASFINCDLERTAFEKCNLEGCDFTTASNYHIDPSANKVRKARFSYPGLLGLLSCYGIIIE